MNGLMYDMVFKPVEKFHLGQIRTTLLASAHGKVLEIGAGTGANFDHYPDGVDVFAIDNDQSMLKRTKKNLHRENIKIEMADAQALPFKNEEFDTVVATLVFCSIPDPDQALREVLRVLKPGGTFLLLEHVRRNTPVVGKTLDLLTPVWKHVAGGCHLNRDPGKTINQLGFKTESVQIIWKGLGKIWHLKKNS